MLRLSVHAGVLDTVSRFNRTDWMDIGYEKLAPVASYKVVYFQCAVGAIPERTLKDYPRWSASLWDLAARAMALSLWPDTFEPRAEAQPVDKPEDDDPHAWATAVTGILELFPPNDLPGGRRLGVIEVVRDKSMKSLYHAKVHEELQKSAKLEPFVFTPRFMRPLELVMRAALMKLSGNIEKLPPMPALSLPRAQTIEGKSYIEIRKLLEPARTGFERWLFDQHPAARKTSPEGFAPEALFAKFIAEAL